MDWRYLLDAFHGRIGRQTFWIALGAVIVLNVLACYFALLVGGDKLNAVVDLVFTYPEFAIAVKRGNDRNMPLWPIATFFGGSVLLDLIGVLGLAGTSEQPSTLTYAITVPFTIFGIGLLIELGFRKGTTGPNPYGPDPLAHA
ncbi:MAG TPA: DUF805 domain-containing protein [Xanthobacteraceae bacterium]|jgi:uncharacterized membrane protein YhaH (DUF805 family)|nr:DUF805 domain-containing protein [Xanthobacteraceae bacterium]